MQYFFFYVYIIIHYRLPYIMISVTSWLLPDREGGQLFFFFLIDIF